MVHCKVPPLFCQKNRNRRQNIRRASNRLPEGGWCLLFLQYDREEGCGRQSENRLDHCRQTPLLLSSGRDEGLWSDNDRQEAFLLLRDRSSQIPRKTCDRLEDHRWQKILLPVHRQDRHNWSCLPKPEGKNQEEILPLRCRRRTDYQCGENCFHQSSACRQRRLKRSLHRDHRCPGTRGHAAERRPGFCYDRTGHS